MSSDSPTPPPSGSSPSTSSPSNSSPSTSSPASSSSPSTVPGAPARARSRPGGDASAAASAPPSPSGNDARDDPALTPSLIGQGPRQYLLGCENQSSFDALKAAFDEELRPADPIERMWADEIIDLEWDLHRLRRTRRTIVENALVERLVQKVVLLNAATGHLPAARMRDALSGDGPPTLAQIKYQARKCVQGDRAGHQYMRDSLGILDMDHELRSVQAEKTEVLARLEYSIHATSRLRDSVVTRYYGRRDGIADGRIASGRAR